MERYKYLAAAGLIVAYLFFPKLFNSGEKSGLAASVNQEVATGCKSLDPQKILASWQSTIDTINRVDDHSVAVHVWTEKWAAAGNKGQVSIAIAAYCSVADASGKGVALIKGSLNEKLGAVVDGNYMR
ncbi:hypothetical protein [Mesorhizobium silamurunense]|uniref:hypothetical protein n=1 Tax=Mesorhizobium silamurunense TaxID=499528 RepID=UPI00177CA49B|nr:hypothetical protein [Mesorhizobium silamurunense]